MNPCCCGLRLQSGVQIIAVFTVVWSLLHGCLQLFEIISYKIDVDEEDTEYDYAGTQEHVNRVKMIFAIGLGIGLTVKLSLSYLLYTGATQLNSRRCKIWFYGTLVVIVFVVSSYILSPIEESWIIESILVVGEPMLLIYFMVVVHSFIQELNSST